MTKSEAPLDVARSRAAVGRTLFRATTYHPFYYVVVLYSPIRIIRGGRKMVQFSSDPSFPFI